MSKKTHIKVDSTWDEVLSVWCKIAGEWVSGIIPWIKAGAQWYQAMQDDSGILIVNEVGNVMEGYLYTLQVTGCVLIGPDDFWNSRYFLSPGNTVRVTLTINSMPEWETIAHGQLSNGVPYALINDTWLINTAIFLEFEWLFEHGNIYVDMWVDNVPEE